ncbi:MAG TPA: hypothetical protein VE287_08040, partial [Actinopolymorphaceae bacterium]|nr:hypothetical protein [Actinopolymorphaceae bacterium]
MSVGQVLLLGFIAGATILLGLPIGRLRRPAPGLKQILNATAAGVLLFLFWDVLSAAFEPLEEPVEKLGKGAGGEIGELLGYGLLFFAGLAIGLMGLVMYESWLAKRIAKQRTHQSLGPGAMAADELG